MGNIAVGKWSSASSEGYGGVASRGNDGNTNGNYGGGSCTHTTGGSPSWWQVDLAGVYNIHSVEIYHRSGLCGANPCAARGNNYKVYISDTPDYTTGTMCDMTGYNTDSPSSNVPCGLASAQYVTISPMVTVCEVEVNVPLTAGLVDTQPCNTDTMCPVDCEGYWRAWGLCSAECGGGTQTRYFEVTSPANYGGACPEADEGTQEQACNTQPCPIDCVGEWTAWGACSLACGGGVQTRDFTVTEQAQFGGLCTHEGITQEQACNQIPCSPDGTPAEIVLEDGLELAANLQYDLPLSAQNVLATISRVDIDGKPYEVGRSYDANEWEGVMPTPLAFDCSAAVTCTVVLPADTSGGDVYVINVMTRADGRTDEMIMAQFLMSATFGQTRASIAEIMAMGGTNDERIANWLDAQMEQAPTLHRAYYRRRVNSPWDIPVRSAGPSHPCQTNSLWHRFAFSEADQGKIVEVSETAGGFTLSVNGVARTELAAGVVDFSAAEPPYHICAINYPTLAGVGGEVILGSEATCEKNWWNNLINGARGWQRFIAGPITLPNPAITFSAVPDGTIVLNEADATFVDGKDPDTKVLQSLNVNCPLTNVGPEDITFIRYGNDYYRHQPVQMLLENTVENPASTAPASFPASPRIGGLTCPTVPKSIFNRDSCVRRVGCTTPLEYSDTPVTLDEATLIAMYRSSGNRHVHYVDGLEFAQGERSGFNPFDPAMVPITRSNFHHSFAAMKAGTLMVSPCSGSSRWRSSDGPCTEETGLDDGTKASIRSAIQTSSDANTRVKDLVVIEGTCSGDDVIGASVTVGDQCWSHTHPANLNVVDFTYWVAGNSRVGPIEQAYGENPTARYAWNDDPRYMMSLSQDGYTWKEFTTSYLRLFTDLYRLKALGVQTDPEQIPGGGYLLARLGDTISFKDLPLEIQTPDFAEFVGATVVGGGEYDGSEACGSYGEVANDATLGHNYGFYGVARLGGDIASTYYFRSKGLRMADAMSPHNDKSALMTNIHTYSEDQLRQKVAWAFNQLLVVSRDAFPSQHSTEMEHWPAYQDIFVRNAFGNYRDILREVAFSVMQGKYLTFHGSRSYAQSIKYPDENFAREFMQLFSIGTVALNPDGTVQRDEDGNPVETYGTRDIANYARAWTGFFKEEPRNNREDRWETRQENLVDPMRLESRSRDREYSYLASNRSPVSKRLSPVGLRSIPEDRPVRRSHWRRVPDVHRPARKDVPAEGCYVRVPRVQHAVQHGHCFYWWLRSGWLFGQRGGFPERTRRRTVWTSCTS